MPKTRIGLSLVMICIIALLAANVFIWRTQDGVYAYSIGVYLAGFVTPLGVVGVLVFLNGKSREAEG